MSESQASEFPHLNKKGLSLVGLPDDERIFAIREGAWIPYPRAKEILVRLEDMYEYPRIDRMPGMMIVGASNNGKTNILRHFEALHKLVPNLDGDYSIIPVLYVEAPNRPDVGKFYDKIMEAIWQPYSIRAKESEKERVVLKVLQQVQLKVLLIDEIQHIIAGGRVKQQEFRNALKTLANTLKICIVCAGVEEAFNVFTTDSQLSNRFEPEFLPKWQLNNSYGDLLRSFEKRIPLKKPSNLHETAMAQKLIWMSEGILGETHEILKRAAVEAIKSGTEQITLEILQNLHWTVPSKRKIAPPPT